MNLLPTSAPVLRGQWEKEQLLLDLYLGHPQLHLAPAVLVIGVWPNPILWLLG